MSLTHPLRLQFDIYDARSLSKTADVIYEPALMILITGQDEGAFRAEIAPFKLKIKGQEVEFSVDEHPK